MLARNSVVIGVPGQNGEEDFFETTVLVDLFHIVKLEPISARLPMPVSRDCENAPVAAVHLVP